MSWVLLVLIGATVNAFINYSFKTYGARINTSYFVGTVMAVGAVGTALYALSQNAPFGALWQADTLLTIAAMGAGMATVWILMVAALVRGPISLVDPLWACIYALGSVLIGMTLAAENPSPTALLGVVTYLAGVVLMAYGARKKDGAKG